MPVYFIVQIDIHDQDGYDRYAEQAGPTMVGTDGIPLVVDDAPVLLEGSWHGSRTIVIQFPDEAAFRKWYDSPAYQDALKLRLASTSSNAVLLQGLG